LASLLQFLNFSAELLEDFVENFVRNTFHVDFVKDLGSYVIPSRVIVSLRINYLLYYC